MLLTILILPVLFAIIIWIANKPGLNNRLIILHALAHLGASVYFLYHKENYPGYFSTDALGVFFFFIISLLYMAVAIYNASFITVDDKKRHSIYTLSLILFVFAMDGAVLASNLGLTWVFIETTTLASAVLIYHERTRTALEASWKYIFICSIGIALAFVGILLLFIAIPQDSSLDYHNLYKLAASINPFWLKIAFVFMLCGFGTKLGLAPLHSWLPDAHSEAPAPVSALLSGALLNTALLPILRMFKLMDLVGLKEMAQSLFMLMGLLSVFVSAVFIIKVKNYKRMLAYSSIENMGIATLAFGIGGLGTKAGFIHLIGHSLVKAAFFLTAGNIYKIFHNKQYDEVQGVIKANAPTGWLWMFAFLFLAAMPPSPLFISEFMLVVSMLSGGHFILLTIFLLLLVIIVYGLGRMAVSVSFGDSRVRVKISPWLYLPQMGLLLFATLVGLYLLPFVQTMISAAMEAL